MESPELKIHFAVFQLNLIPVEVCAAPGSGIGWTVADGLLIGKTHADGVSPANVFALPVKAVHRRSTQES